MPIPSSTIQHSCSGASWTKPNDGVLSEPTSPLPHVTKIEMHIADRVCAPLKSPPKAKPPIEVPSTKKLPFIDVFRKILKMTDGRDKLMKLIQYALKIILLTYFHRSDRHPNLRKQASALSGSFSNTRKILRLGNCVEPYNKLKIECGKLPKLKSYDSIQLYLYIRVMFKTSVSLINTLSDDLFCLSKLGVLSSNVGRRTGRLSLRLWMINIILDSQDSIQEVFRLWSIPKEGSSQIEKEKPNDELFWSCLNVVKLFCDGMFCSYDILECRFSPLFQASVSFISGVLGTYKLWFKTATIRM